MSLAASCFHSPAPQEIDPALCSPPTTGFAGVVIAGSGADVPLVRALLTRDEPEPGVRVAESIGSSGAVTALEDGAIDIGLISRPLRSGEASEEVDVLPFATSTVVWAAHPDVAVERVSEEFVADVYRGERVTWPNGLPAVPVVREAGDSGLETLRQTYPAIVDAVEEARLEGRGLLATTDDEALTFVERIPGAIGPADLGLLAVEDSPARGLEVGDHSLDTLPRRTLALIYHRARRAELAPVLERVVGIGSDSLVDELGYARPR